LVSYSVFQILPLLFSDFLALSDKAETTETLIRRRFVPASVQG
jgi:hypothetical protein